MAGRQRTVRYRSEGAGTGLIRVEVLVPPEGRRAILEQAARLRAEHRRPEIWNERLERLHTAAVEAFGTECLWNIKASKTQNGMRVVADSLRARGGMDAWRLAAEIREELANAVG